MKTLSDTITNPADIEALDTTISDGLPFAAASRTLGEQINGSGANESLTGTAGDDTIRAGGGNDLVIGLDGDDFIDGGNGRDTIDGGDGDDDIRGGDGNDALTGGEGDDEIRGGDGNDFIRGGAGADFIDGGRGRDTATYSDSAAAVTVSLSQGTNPQRGGDAEGDVLRGIDNLNGSAFNDRLTGDNNSNQIRGGNGDDVIAGLGGRDTIDGGSGDDFIIANNGGGREFDGGAGNDTLRTNSRVELRDDEISSIENLEIQASSREDAVARLNSSQMTFETISFNSVNDRAAVVDVRLDTADVDLSQIAFDGFQTGRDQVEIVANNQANRITGSEVDDFVRAGGGNDTVNGGAGNDDIRGGDGRDALIGGTGDDEIRGEDGDDVIRGGEGADFIDGGSGRDTATYSDSAGRVIVSLAQGTEPQRGGDAEGDVLRGIDNLNGSAHDDRLTGDNNANVIRGGSGNDVIAGNLGRDTIDGGNGNDTVIVRDGGGRDFDGGAGFDTLRTLDRVGLNGDDEVTNFEALEIRASSSRDAFLKLDADQVTFEEITFESQNGRNVVVEILGDDTSVLDLSTAELTGFGAGDQFRFFGGNGSETVTGTALGDRLEGRNGNDRLNGEGGDDFLDGGNDRDTIDGGAGDDDIRGGDGNDALTGGEGDDEIRGGDGNDFIRGGEGADFIDGGRGRDTATYSDSAERVIVSLSQGSDPQRGGDAEGDVLRGIDNLNGSAFDDRLTGNDDGNRIRGGDGNDVISGRGGRDTIEAGAGDDTVIVNDGGGRSFDGGAGFDTLRVSDRVGLNGDDEVTNFEALEIRGEAGRDARLRIDAGQMTFEEITYESQNGRSVDIEIFGDGTSVLDLSGAVLTGFDDTDQFRFIGSDTSETVTGTELGDRLEGRNGNDRLNGEGGDDELVGGNGNDVLNGGDGADRLFGQDGNDVLVGGAGSDLLDGGSGIDRVDYSASAEGIDIVLDNGNRRGDGGDAGGDRLISIENVTATAFDDLIRGSNAANAIETGAGDDVVDGRGGDDRLDGGAGNDALTGGSGADLLIGGTGDDRLSGGAGEDLLIGGVGDDLLAGGADADTFRFTERAGFGDDVVLDFEARDTIQLLREEGVNGFDDLDFVQNVVNLGGGETRVDTVIELDAGSITLQGVDFALQESNFDFFG